MKIYSYYNARFYESWVARPMGIELHGTRIEGPRQRGKYQGRFLSQFMLKPMKNDMGEKQRLVRMSYEGKPRRVWACSWQAHYDFLEAVFSYDPQAVVITAIERYEGRQDFYKKADATGSKNIGSVMQPLAYADANINLIELNGNNHN